MYHANVSAPRRQILVTGASGFLGAHVVRAMQRRDVAVRAHGRDAARLQFDGNVQACRGDLTDLASLIEAARGCDAIIHAGALSAPWGAPRDFIDANVVGTANVIAAARATGVRRLVHISSPAVLFDGRDQIGIDETAPYPARFTSEYARTKHLAELMVRAAGAVLETVILRPKAIYGAGDRALVPRLLRAARQGRLPQIGDGTNEVDVTHVDDVVRAVGCALTTERGIGQTFLVTGAEHVPLWPMIRELLAGVGLPAPRRQLRLGVALAVAGTMEAIARVTGREPSLTRYSAQILARMQTYDIAHTRRLLGYEPRVTASSGIARTIDALRAAGDAG